MNSDESGVRLDLDFQPAGRQAPWPHPFHASFQATFGTNLTMTLGLRHLGTLPARYEMALHPYIAVGDIARVRISGLENAPFEDHAHPPAPGSGLAFGEQGIDRVYDCSTPLTIHDDANNRNIVMRSPDARKRIIWNPGADSVPGLEERDWRSFLCVEPGNVGNSAPLLNPGQQETFTTVIEVHAQPVLRTS